MVPDHVDAIAKTVVSATTRRLTLGALLSGALGALGLAVAEAKVKAGTCTPSCNECQTCKTGKCKKTNRGKKKCKQGTCQAQAVGTPCSIGTCRDGVCTAFCQDGIKNNGESDIDCGGLCPRCATGKTCASRNDCASAICADTCQTCTPGDSCSTTPGACRCEGPPSVAAPVCVALPEPGSIMGSCPGSCPPTTMCLTIAPGVVVCASPCTAL